MFGIVYGIVQLVGRTVFRINAESIRLDSKHEAIKNGKDYYFDSRGAMWYCGNGHDERCTELYCHNIITGKHDSKNGHHVLISFNDKRVLKDYTVEQNTKEDIEFCNRYNKAINQARLDGKAYFCVVGLGSLDKRYGHYELETEKLYTLDKIQGSKIKKAGRYPYITTIFEQDFAYYKNYYNGRSKNNVGNKERIKISKEEYEKLGGDSVMSSYTTKGVGGYYQRDYY